MVIQERDSDVVIFFGMLILTFPSGLVVVWLIRTLASLGLTLPGGVLGQYMGLAVLVLVGYCQWFVLLPRLVRLVRRAQPGAPGDAPPKGVAPLS